jgi:hypothetical protein
MNTIHVQTVQYMTRKIELVGGHFNFTTACDEVKLAGRSLKLTCTSLPPFNARPPLFLQSTRAELLHENMRPRSRYRLAPPQSDRALPPSSSVFGISTRDGAVVCIHYFATDMFFHWKLHRGSQESASSAFIWVSIHCSRQVWR